MKRDILLHMRSMSKHYPGVQALDSVDFDLFAGEIHALVGENGAGKSTLTKILAGAEQSDSGTIEVSGRTIAIREPADARRLGIGIIYQEFKLVPELSVAENIFLGDERRFLRHGFVRFSLMHAEASKVLSRLGETIDPVLPVRKLSVSQRQIVEIAKALSNHVRILAMDEPTASLTDREVENLFAVMRNLKTDGVGIIYISHRIEEIFRIADRITVLRDGKLIHSCPVAEADSEMLVKWMVGREADREAHQWSPKGIAPSQRREILRIENLTSDRVHGISFGLDRGEILGLAGLTGSGRTELVRLIFGAERRSSGRIVVDGREVSVRSPGDAIKAGIGLLTEDRNLDGLVLQMSVLENITLSSLSDVAFGPFVNGSKERRAASELVRRLRIKTRSVETPVETLSGGNRQKVVLGRWLMTQCNILIFDEPTAGIDIAVKREIHALIRGLASEGRGIIVISSELPELLQLCDRIAVLCDGIVAGILTREEATQERLMKLATSYA